MKLLHKIFILLIFACFALTACKTNEPVSEVEPLPFTKGVNLLRWFETWNNTLPPLNKYDEADFACLKSMGVDIIRLPIHFEFVMEPNYTGKIDNIILEKLDQVCDWAEKYQIYLVIDNHSFNDPEQQKDATPETYETHLKALWPQIAERYKNRSEYIIYEILNEPPEDLMNSWDKIQREILALIRQYDTKHTVVVTTANWSHTDDLIKMKPYEDKNLIYAFHFYLPEMFANQGTGVWSANIRDLPFPYDKKRMPKLDDSLEAWVKNNIQTIYPQQGNEAFLNNKIKEVADWAKKNNVRIWCGELGVAARMMPKDRLYCIKTNVAALNNYNIPYCTWGIDADFGFLETEDLSLIFPDDIDKYALDAYGLKLPDESLVSKTNLELKTFPQQPYVVFDGLCGKGTSTYHSYLSKAAKDDESHNYFQESSGMKDANFILNLPKAIASKVAEYHNELALSFTVKFNDANQVFEIHLVDSDGGEKLPPWRNTVYIRASDYKVGEWLTVEVPMSKFKESGAWSDKVNKWYNPQGKFDWSRFEHIFFGFHHDNNQNGDIYIDDVMIKQK
ncbi:MAG: cellulase family glycosylhydrolase [Spirochaetaceae bacterium]|nr:cellulase family glycosylhydrolase [Spirochaetaceae bacterium]